MLLCALSIPAGTAAATQRPTAVILYYGAGGGGFAWVNGLSDYVIAHELGHTLGAPHAAALRCLAADGVTPVTYSDDCAEIEPETGEPGEYGDPLDPMGSGADLSPQTGYFVPHEMTAWRKLNFGAIPATDAPTITYSGTYALAPGGPDPTSGPSAHCTVPNLKRKKLRSAKQAIRRARCHLGKVKRRRSKGLPSGRVISQKPTAGRKLALGARVNLVVSSRQKRR
jgi:hypothetical protein